MNTNPTSTVGKQLLQVGSCDNYATLPSGGSEVNSLSNSGGSMRIVSEAGDARKWGMEAASRLQRVFKK
jgi:hypothetical protein